MVLGVIIKMRLLVILMLLASSQALYLEPECDLISIHGINYEKEIIKDNLVDPYQMVIDYDTNTLFLSYTVDKDVDDSDVFKSAYMNLKTNEYNTIPGIKGGFAATVDKKNHTVYLGGRDGIYEFDYDTRRAKHIDRDGLSVWQMFFKDKLYYTTYPEEQLYTFDGNSTKVAGLEHTRVLLVAVDTNDNIYFSNSSGLFYYAKKDNNFSYLGEYNVNSFTADINSNLYFSTPEGFYNIDSNKKVSKLAHVIGVYGLVVEGDNNFIYGTSTNIIRLKPTKQICFVSDKRNMKSVAYNDVDW